MPLDKKRWTFARQKLPPLPTRSPNLPESCSLTLRACLRLLNQLAMISPCGRRRTSQLPVASTRKTWPKCTVGCMYCFDAPATPKANNIRLEKEFTEIRDIRSLPGEAIKKLTSKQEAHNKAVEEVRETGSVKANKPFSLASSHDEAWLAQFITRKIKKKSKDDSQARAIMKKLSGDAEEGANDELA